MTLTSTCTAEPTVGSAAAAASTSALNFTPTPSSGSPTPPPEVSAQLASIAHAVARLRDIEWWRLADGELLASAAELERVLRSGHGPQLRLAAEIAGRGIAETVGERGPAQLLAGLLRIPPGQARARLATARVALGSDSLTGGHIEPALPQLAAAIDAGTVSDDHAAVITAAAAAIPEPVDADTRALCHQLLLDEAAHRDPVALKRVGEQIRLICNPDGRSPRHDPADRAELHIGALRPDGLTPIRGLLDPLTVEHLRVAVEALAAPKPIDDKTRDLRPAPLRRAHALAEILARYFAAGCPSNHPDTGPTTTSNHPAVAITIPISSLIPPPRNDAPATGHLPPATGHLPAATGHLPAATGRLPAAAPGQFDYGNPAATETARQLACHGILIRQIITDDGAILDQGRGRRLFTRAQRRALTTRDRGCAFPGCDIPPGWCQAHHIAPWTNTNGPTNLANGVLLCARHCPASSSWQEFFSFEVGDCGVGQAQVHLQWPVPGDGLVGPDGVVLDAVVLGSFDEGERVGDVVEEQPLVFQGPEPAFA